MSTAAGRIFIGTSGWTYKDWRGSFYPAKMPQGDWLTYYTGRFETVELNVTTYRLPKPSDIERWNAVRPDFRYTIKLSRLVTHRKTPGDPQAFVDRFFAAIEPLKPRVANVLAQFPPHFARNEAALTSFLDALPAGYRYVVEFRHPSWYCEHVYELLRERSVSLCLHDFVGSVTPLVSTGPVLYIRLHGAVSAYVGSYGREQLLHWASVISARAGGVYETFIYFNNDHEAAAPVNAEALRQLIADVI